MLSYLAIDFETSGLNRDADRIIQVGLCSIVEGKVIAQDGWLVNQNVHIDPEAAAVNGLTIDDLRMRGIPPVESLNKLLDHIRAAPACIGHNIHRFDIRFLLAECRRLGTIAPKTSDYVDTAALYKGWKLGMKKLQSESHAAYAERIFRERVKGLKYSIPVCIHDLKITADLPTIHQASHDAYLTHLIFEALRARIS